MIKLRTKVQQEITVSVLEKKLKLNKRRTKKKIIASEGQLEKYFRNPKRSKQKITQLSVDTRQ